MSGAAGSRAQTTATTTATAATVAMDEEKIIEVVECLLQAMLTVRSDSVQSVMANTVFPLIQRIKSNTEYIYTLLDRLLTTTTTTTAATTATTANGYVASTSVAVVGGGAHAHAHRQSHTTRRGATYAIAALVKGCGISLLMKQNVVTRMISAF